MRLIYLSILLFSVAALADDHVASSASRADVQTAVDAASDGDRVLIPNGSATWTSGITTTKQIRIEAQNYTPTDEGTDVRNVTITHSYSGDLFNMTSGDDYHVGIGGIEFDRGSSSESYVVFQGSGTKIPLLYDCAFEDTNGPEGASSAINSVSFISLGGLAWNCLWDGSDNPWSGSDVGINIAKTGIHITSPRAWTTASTMGDADTNGDVNVYFEDCSWLNAGALDADNNGRFVIRYSDLDGTRYLTHGFTSTWGGRHWEIYNSTFSVTSSPRNLAGAYFWCRAGTGIFTDNTVNDTSNTGDYGSVSLLMIGDNTTAGSYPMDRQPGGGHNGTSYVVDPIYIWNNSGAQAYTWFFNGDVASVGWSGIVQLNRDIYVDNGAKPSYTKYTYPHPERSIVEGGDEVTPGDGNVNDVTVTGTVSIGA